MLQGPAFNAVTVENVIIANSWPLRLKYLLSSEVNPIICKGEKVLNSVRENVVSHSKNVKSHVFLDFEKNVKKRKKTYVVSQATLRTKFLLPTFYVFFSHFKKT